MPPAPSPGGPRLDRRSFLATAAGAGLSACAHLPPRQQEVAAGAEARSLYDRIFDEIMLASPMSASSLGLDTGSRAALKWRIGDASARYRSVAPFAAALARLRAIDRRRLARRDQAWLDTAIWFGERARETASIPYGGIDGSYPVPYRITHFTGLYKAVPAFLGSGHGIETRDDAEAYLARLEAFPGAIDLELESVRTDAAYGVIPPATILDRTIAETRLRMAERGADAGLVQSLVRRARERGISGDWEARAVRIVDGPLAAALARQAALLESWRPLASALPGVSRLPDGERFYAQALRLHTSAMLSPADVHRIGLAQVAELSGEADTLLRAQGLSQGSVAERLEALGGIRAHQFADGDAGREELLTYARELLATLRGRMAELFRTLPASPMEVRRVPSAIESASPGAYAEPGDVAGTRPGIFFVNLARMSGRARWRLPTLVCHETVPGHLWQRASLFAIRDIPQLHRTMAIAAYDEGWGLYGETLGDELGLYREDPLGRIGMVQSLLFRAARLVVDTGLHAMGWSREQATGYFRQVLGPGLEREIDRYTIWPGQATAYKIGHIEMLRIREATRRRLGGRFDIKAYHELVLSGGGMPLEVLAARALEWDGAAVA